MRTLAKIESDEELWQRWLSSPWVRRFERGQCSADEFAAGLVAEWELGIPADAFLESIRNWPGETMPGATALLADVQREMPIGCLSNINALHWETQFDASPIFDVFDYRFLSFELGMVKPDSELFEHIGLSLPVPRARVLFLDDNARNVDAATAAGFTAVAVRGVDEARQALVVAGVLKH